MKRFHDEQSGTAMTEFVIGLPIFILIFGGVLNLQRLNAEALGVMAVAEQQVWVESLRIQTERFADPRRTSPLASTGAELLDGPDGLDVVSSLSFWADSGIKTELPTAALDGTVEPVLELEEVMGTADLFSHQLMDDTTGFSGGVVGDGWAGIFSSVLGVAGARPALAAGIRYGTVTGEARRTLDTSWGEVELAARLRLPAATFPTHRIYAVALTRAELATDVRYDEAIVVFDSEVKTATDVPPTEDLDTDSNPLQSIFDDACSEAEGVAGCN